MDHIGIAFCFPIYDEALFAKKGDDLIQPFFKSLVLLRRRRFIGQARGNIVEKFTEAIPAQLFV